MIWYENVTRSMIEFSSGGTEISAMDKVLSKGCHVGFLLFFLPGLHSLTTALQSRLTSVRNSRANELLPKVTPSYKINITEKIRKTKMLHKTNVFLLLFVFNRRLDFKLPGIGT